MNRLRALIVDDEPPARELLRELLAPVAEVEVVGEAGDGLAAVDLIERLRPDLVFLDVQMPELDGFEVLEAIGPESMPAVVFVTAYDRYALRAFEVHALDYLLKPFDDERFAAAVRHAVQRVRHPPAAELRALLHELRSRRGLPGRLPIRQDGVTTFLEVTRIDWIEADDKLVRIHAGSQVHLMRTTLSALLERLDPSRFLRIHRSTIVNIARVREIQPWFQSDFVLILEDGTRLMTGRAYRTALEHLRG